MLYSSAQPQDPATELRSETSDSSPLSEYDLATCNPENECAGIDDVQPYQHPEWRTHKGSGSSNETVLSLGSSHEL